MASLPQTNNPKDICHKSCFGLCKREFAQQKLPYNRFFVFPACFSIAYFVVGIIAISMGAVFSLDADTVVEVGPVFYEQTDCSITKLPWCMGKITFEWNAETGDKPVFMYYHLTNFYQAHRKFVQNGYSDLVANAFIPQPIQNASMFTDSYSLFGPDNSPVAMSTDAISFPADVDYFWNAQLPRGGKRFGKKTSFADGPGFGNFYYCTRYKNCECTTEACLNWRRPSAGTGMRPDFNKLFGRIPGGLKKGKHTVVVDNMYDASSFGGKKGIMLSTMGQFGGKRGSTFLGSFSTGFGVVCLVMAVLTTIMKVGKERDLYEYLVKLKEVPGGREQIFNEIRRFRTDLTCARIPEEEDVKQGPGIPADRKSVV